MRIVLTLAFFLVSAVLATTVLVSAGSMADLHRAVAELQSPEQRTEHELKNLMEALSLGAYTGGSERSEQLAAMLAAADTENDRAHAAALGLALLSAVFLLPSLFSLRRGLHGVRALAHDLLSVSLVFLVVGVLAPVLSVTVRREVPLLGEVVLQHNTKSIFDTIGHLADTGNWFTAVLLAAFSVLTPAVKLLLSWLAAGTARVAVRRVALSIVHHVGRWSMTDVFVVAVLIAFLAAGADGLTRAVLGLGLYFFAAYGIVSQIAGHLLAQHEARLLAANGGTRTQET